MGNGQTRDQQTSCRARRRRQAACDLDHAGPGRDRRMAMPGNDRRMSAVVCPKCGYARKAADAVPAWQCPSCGIAYNKFRPDDSPGQSPSAPGDRRETVMEGAPWEAKFVRGNALALLFFFLLAVGIFSPLAATWSWVLPVMTVIAFFLW